MKKHLRNLRHNQSGIALLEFIITLPVLLALVFCMVEVTRYIWIVQKVDKAVYVLTDLVGQYQPATLTGTTNAPAGTRYDGEIGLIRVEKEVLDNVDEMLAPFNTGNYWFAVTSVVRNSGTGDKIRWQVVRNNWVGAPVYSVTGFTTFVAPPGKIAHLMTDPINVTPCGGNANWVDPTIPGILGSPPAMPDGENFIVGEIAFQYTPLYRNILTGLNGVFGNIFFTDPTVTLRRDAFLHPRNTHLLDLPYSWQSGTGVTSTSIVPAGAGTPPSSDTTNLGGSPPNATATQPGTACQ